MKLLVLFGSPRKNKNTKVLLDHYLEGVKDSHPQVEISFFDVTRMNIKGCNGCEACQREVVNYCSIKDDMDIIYKEYLESDVIVFVSPIYYFSVTAQLKAAIDRTYALLPKNIKGKKIVFLSTYGGTKEDSGYHLASEIFRMEADFSGMKYVQNYGANSYPVPIKDNKVVLDEVFALGKELQ